MNRLNANGFASLIMLCFLLAFGVTACTAVKEAAPERQYYVLNQVYVGLLKTAKVVVVDCLGREDDHPCRKGIKPLQTGVKASKKAFDAADKIFAAGDPTYYQLAMTSAGNAVDKLKNLVANVKP